MKKFEYQMLEVADGSFSSVNRNQKLIVHLNSLGLQGWEVVSVTRSGSVWGWRSPRLVVTLKREVEG
ncbi:hypothetical protein A0257_01230 [Hymenobacter psoromatis]|nr:hypothetical protein A0257_01230 [Hymenobacter psoromatis]